MRNTTFLPKMLSSFALGLLLAGSLAIAPSFADDHRPAALVAGQPWLSIGQVFTRLETAGYTNVEKIEREDGHYEAKASDRQGRRVKLYVHPQTGEISESWKGGRKYDEASGNRYTRDGRASSDCNKRRCRDDLPAAGTVTPATK